MPQNRTHRTVSVLLTLLAAVSLVACSPSSQDHSAGRPAGAPQQATHAPKPESIGPENADSEAPGSTERLIVRTLTLRFEVASTPETVDAVRELASQHSATISNMRVASEDSWVYDSPSKEGSALQGWMTVRVPVDSLDAFIDGTKDLGKLDYQNETSDDVTQEHVDLSARLKNLRAQEERLRELAEKAATVEEVLTVEKELWRIRGEIESLDAQVEYLENQAAMATVTLEFTEKNAKQHGSDEGFGRALRNGFELAAAVVAFLATFVIATSPLWLLGLAGFFIVRKIRRARRAARHDPDPGDRRASGRPAADGDAAAPADDPGNADEDTPAPDSRQPEAAPAAPGTGDAAAPADDPGNADEDTPAPDSQQPETPPASPGTRDAAAE